jgi:hypothetical protein
MVVAGFYRIITRGAEGRSSKAPTAFNFRQAARPIKRPDMRSEYSIIAVG